MRKKIVAGNWKMNMTSDSSSSFIKELNSSDWPSDVECVIAPPSLFLEKMAASSKVAKIAGQNCHNEDSGAFTGEISAEMLSDVGAKYCLVGHSERREYFKESAEFLRKKVDMLLSKKITPIYCFGETKDQRESGSHFNVVESQLKESLFHLSPNDFKNIVLAYEPVWAIGTGLTATSAEAQEMHAFVRSVVEKQYPGVSENISILYGGSCKPANAPELFACKDVDGGLIGGASLKVDSFVQIAQSY